jgi:undecaprenyl-diphosphatase
MPRWLEAGRQRGHALDERWARSLHSGGGRPILVQVFVWSSRLGDAPMWLLLALLLPVLDPAHGVRVTLELLALGAVNLVVYAALKFTIRRARPCQQCAGIQARIEALDRFSFPSGHTLHAVAFAALLSQWYPALAPLVAVFAAVVALSRVVLGVHYPSDVVAGAVLGLSSASTLHWLFLSIG